MVEFIRNLFAPEKRAQYSIVALLDEEHEQFIRAIWQELDSELGIKHLFADPIPHITHLQVEEIKIPEIYDALEKFAENQKPYTLRTVGLGLFTGNHQAVYVSVVRTPELTAVQTTLTSILAGSIGSIRETHYINNWMPHISLLLPDMVGNQLGAVIERLAKREFSWELPVTRLTILRDINGSEKPPIIHLKGANNG